MPRCELYTSSVATAFGWQLLVQEIHGMAAWHELRSGMKVRMQDFYVFFPLILHLRPHWSSCIAVPLWGQFLGAMDVERMSFQRQPFHVRSGGDSNIYI